MASKYCVFLICLCIVLSGLLSAQDQPIVPKTYPATLWVPCDEHHPAPRLVVGSTLVAKATGVRATVKVDQDGSCANTTNLIESAEGSQKIWVEPPKPKEHLTGNGMNLVDWSPDGKMLLAELWYWTQEPNDAGIDKQVLVFSPEHGSVRQVETETFLADQNGHSCNLDFELLGFTPEGWVAMRTQVTQFYEVDEQERSDIPAAKRCVEKHEVWAIDPETQLRTALPEGFRAERYSNVGSAR
jgi:hypothetical protein